MRKIKKIMNFLVAKSVSKKKPGLFQNLYYPIRRHMVKTNERQIIYFQSFVKAQQHNQKGF